jgi:hypothetical protein
MDNITTTGRRNPTLAELMVMVREQPTMRKYWAGRLLNWGERSVDLAIESGDMPVIAGPKDVVPCAWLREVLRLKP